ncbi:MAG: hypothetical protein KAU20_06210 [Nanoarchaeota archaeon]|nr:hypothetical protein [Nanoarchaeota archaeon]
MASDVVVNYMKRGLEKGFNLNYIKDILIKNGHSEEDVESAADMVLGLKQPESLKPHLDEVKGDVKKPIYPVIMGIAIILLLIAGSFFAFSYFSNKRKVADVQTQLEEVRALGINIDDLQDEIKTQLALIKEKDLTIDEKERILGEQIRNIEELTGKIDEQRVKLNSIILDLLNRMISRME